MTTIIKINTDQFVILKNDGYGYELESVHNLQDTVKELEKQGKDHQIIALKYLKLNDLRLYTIIKTLILLRGTNCGCCHAPWLRSDIFNDLVAIIREYIEDGENSY